MIRGKAVQRSPMSSHHKENTVFLFFLSFLCNVSLEDGCQLNLLWSSSHTLCRSRHHTVRFKRVQGCLLIISQESQGETQISRQRICHVNGCRTSRTLLPRTLRPLASPLLPVMWMMHSRNFLSSAHNCGCCLPFVRYCLL